MTRLHQAHINTAAQFLIDRRNTAAVNSRLAPELRPATTAEALAIQRAIVARMADRIGGWKCVLPAADKLNVAPIFANTIHATSPCPIRLERGVCRIEPEIAFRFKQDLPPRDKAYSDDEIKNALGGTHMALELIENRYTGADEATYLENLADCLFNQGLYLGPEIPMDKAIHSPEIDFVLTQGATRAFKGKHPNNGSILPVLWLTNFLRESGIGIQAGQVVITGSFAGVHEVQPNREFTLEYTGLGKLSVLLEPVAN